MLIHSESLKLEHPDLAPFEPTLRQCNTVAHTGGLRALETAGKRSDEIYQSKGTFRKFIRGCHYGFDLAQKRVGQAVIEIEEKIRTLEPELRHARHHRTPDVRDILEKLKILRARQLVLRRLIDSVLWAMLAPSEDQWALRHMWVEHKIRRIEPEILKRTIDQAVARNKSDRLKFSVVCDLTTAAQVGDLIEIDRSALSKSAWRVIELKDGKVNALLTSAIEEKGEAFSKRDWNELQTKHGERAVGQARRMLRQRDRQSELQRIVESDEGVSPEYNQPVLLFDGRPTLHLQQYDEAVTRVCAEIDKDGGAWAAVDGCLRIVALKSEHFGHSKYGAVAHLFYHLAGGGGDCLLRDSLRRDEELRGVASVPPFVDLVEENMFAPWGSPIFLWKGEKRILDLIMGRISLFVQFDMDAFFDLAKSEGVTLSWMTKKPDVNLRRLSGPIVGSPGAYAVRAEFADGTVTEFLSGIFRRAVADLTSPKQLIRLMKLYGEKFKELDILPPQR